MVDKRESVRQKAADHKKVLDQVSRQRRRQKALEALESDNFSEDPHADLKMSKKAPKFDETMEMLGGNNKKRRKSKVDFKLRYKKTFATLLEEEQILHCEGANYFSACVPPSVTPARHFCAVCGFPSDYKCVQCGTRFCSVRCLGVHRDTRCLKWTA